MARNIRTFIILDCCFAAAAGKSFMSDDQVVATQLKTAFASKGIVLMCATSKDSPAYLIKERNITMFTEGLDHAFKKGDSSISNPFLTLREINEISYSFINR